MTTAQLVEMKKAGFDIGAHSIDHPLYADIDNNDQKHQTQKALWLQ